MDKRSYEEQNPEPEGPEQAEENSSLNPSTTRRKVIKGMFTAPAIMAIGSVPALAHSTSPAKDKHKDDHGDKDWWDDDDKNDDKWPPSWWPPPFFPWW